MLALVSDELGRELTRTGIPATSPTYWLVVRDATGVVTSQIDPPDDDGTNPMHDLYDRDPTIEGIATVSLVRPHGREELLASVIVRDPENSDLRRAVLRVDSGGAVTVGPWEYTII